MNFNVENILVVGLGMIGSSIAVAAKSKGIKVNGADLDENVVKKAIDEFTSHNKFKCEIMWNNRFAKIELN